MDANDIQDGAAGPPMGYQGAVWPPPPDSADIPRLIVPFKNIFMRDKGSVPDFRTGSITITQGGVTVAGKGTLRYEIRTPLILFLWLLSPLNLVGYLIIESMKSDQSAQIPWDRIQKIILRQRKRQACIVYDYPNYRGVVKTFSLSFDLKENFNSFAGVVQEFIPDRVSEGKLRAWNSPPVIVILIILLVYFCAIIGIGAMKYLAASAVH